jgi:outer membrane protein TolC
MSALFTASRNTFRKAVLLGSVLVLHQLLPAQQVLLLDSCYARARANYPQVKQLELIEKSRDYSLSNASKGFLPQVQLGLQATYQSAVTELPIMIPNLTLPSLSKDQYKIYADVVQPLTDIITVKQQKELIEANAAAEAQKLETELYKLRERVSQLYFGILLLDAQLQQTTLLKKDIQSGLTKTNAAIANGIATRSNADVLQAELLRADQRTIELQQARNGFADMLALFTGLQVDERTMLQTPEVVPANPNINRPELKLFELQKHTYDIQNKLLTTRNIPRASLFVQGGYGRPTLNMLTNAFDFYYIGGLRISWNLSGQYTLQKERQLLSLNQRMLDVQRETFVFGTSVTIKQQDREVNKYSELVRTDNELITLREKIKKTAESQLGNGTISATDFLNYVNAEDQARQNQALHKLQWIQALHNYQFTTGN